MLYRCHTYEIRNARVFCQVLFWCLSTPHVLKLSNPTIHIVISQFCQLHFCQIVKSTLFQVQFSCLPTFTFAKLQGQNCPILKSAFSSVHSQVADCTLLFCYFVKLPSPLHLLDCPNELQVPQVWYPSSTWGMAKWACKLPKSDFLAQLGQGAQWTSITITLWCDVQTVFHFLLDKLTQYPYGVKAWHLLLLLS